MRMDKAGTLFTLNTDSGKYNVELPPEDYLILIAGAVVGSAGEAFNHPNVVVRNPKVFDLKHYNPVRGKWWSTKAGIDFFFVIPKDKIELIEAPGYSYPKIRIGNRTYHMNVSGGTFPKGEWTDTVRQGAHIGIAHPLKSLRNLAENALSPEECKERGISFPVRPETRMKEYMEISAGHKVRDILAPGKFIMLTPGTYYSTPGNRGPYQIENISKKRRTLICMTGTGHFFRVRYKNIDWMDTASANNLTLEIPEIVNHVGEILEVVEK